MNKNTFNKSGYWIHIFLSTYYVLGIHAKGWEHKNESKTQFLFLRSFHETGGKQTYIDNFLMIQKEQDIIETLQSRIPKADLEIGIGEEPRLR